MSAMMLRRICKLLSLTAAIALFNTAALACESEETYQVTLKKLDHEEPGCLPLQFEFPRRIGHNDKARATLLVHENGQFNVENDLPISAEPSQETDIVTTSFCLPEERLEATAITVMWYYYDEKTGLTGMCTDSMATGTLRNLLEAGGTMSFTPDSR
jgi:hypothetical protein